LVKPTDKNFRSSTSRSTAGGDSSAPEAALFAEPSPKLGVSPEVGLALAHLGVTPDELVDVRPASCTVPTESGLPLLTPFAPDQFFAQYEDVPSPGKSPRGKGS
jgi:hypothetical protein